MHPFLMEQLAQQRRLEMVRSAQRNLTFACDPLSTETRPSVVRLALGKRLVRLGVALLGPESETTTFVTGDCETC